LTVRIRGTSSVTATITALSPTARAGGTDEDEGAIEA
jgi:hypothetical protein